MKLIFKQDNLVYGLITKRPSRQIKSPYVADVLVLDEKMMENLKIDDDETKVPAEVKSTAKTKITQKKEKNRTD